MSSFFPAPDLESHIAEAMFLNAGGMKEYTGPEWQVPVSEFLRTLKPPINPALKNLALYSTGELTFNKSCKGCHSDAQGGNGKLFKAEAMGLLERYNSPLALSTQPSSSLSKRNFTEIEAMMKARHPEYDFSKRGVRPRRLKGVWAINSLMTTGAIGGLDHAFCLNGKTRKEIKPTSDDSDSVHIDLCNKYSDSERQGLKEYLSHWN